MIPRRFPLLKVFLVFGLILASCSTSVPTTIPVPTSTPFQAIPARPTSTALPAPTAVLPPEESPTAVPSSSVFLISWDGARADLVYDLMDQGLLPHFAEVAQRGVRAEYAQSVDPSLTAPAQNAIASGANPAGTGIVSNAYHNSADNFYWYRDGFGEPMESAEPVWVTASKAGLTTASVFFPAGSLVHPGQMADYTISYGVRDAYSRQETVSLSAAGEWEGAPSSYSPALEGSYQIPEVSRIFLLVLDSSDDGVTNYDTLLVDTDRQVTTETPRLGVGDWGSLVLRAANQTGADFLAQVITPRQVTFYHTGVYHNTASPRELLEGLNRRFGYFRAGFDSYALEHGWTTVEDNLYLQERASLWMAEVAAWVYETYWPDLIFTWQDDFDAAGHAFLLQDPLQAGFTPQRAAEYQDYYRRVAEMADRALETMLGPVDLKRTNLLLVADHGMAPVHTSVYVNTVLEQAGLLTLDEKNYLVVEESQAFAVASGGAANIYINLKGREKNGILDPADYSGLREEIITLLNGLSDPATGQPVFQRVLSRQELAPLGLDHPNAGDIFAQANPGYNLDGWRGWDDIFASTKFFGQHGYDSHLPEMQALFIASGPNLTIPGELIPPVSVLDYAPTIAALLGFEPAPGIDGQPIPAFVEP